jgi:PAS domain S-box-containing protein
MPIADVPASALRDLWSGLDVALLAVDPDSCRVVAANPGAVRLTGYTADELCALTPQDLYDDRYAAAAGEDPYAAEIVLLRRKDGSSREIRVCTALGQDEGARMRFDGLLDATAEASSRRDAALFRAIVESATDHIVTSDTRGFVTYANPAALGELGYDREELVGRFIGELQPSSDFEALGALILDVTAAGGEWRGEVTALRKDQTTYPAHIATAAVRDEHGRPAALLLVARNMTREKEAQRELLFFRDVVAKAMEAIIATDLAGRITYLNAAACDRYGYTPEELIGRHFSLVVTGTVFREQTPLDDGRGVAAALFDATLQDGGWQGEICTRTKTGEPILLHLVTYRLDDADGRPVALIGLGRDVTERKRMEEALREGEARYRTLFEDSPIALWEWDLSALKEHVDSLRASGVTDFRALVGDDTEEVARCMSRVKVLSVNKATLELSGDRTIERLMERIGTVRLDRIDDLDRECVAAVAEGLTRFDCEAVQQTGAGEKIHVAARWAVAPGHEATYSRVFVSIIDITERKRAEHELRRSQERYRAIVEDQTELICRWLPDGTLTFVNDAYCRYFHKSPEELVGHSYRPAIPEEDHEMHLAHIASLTRDNPVGVNEHRVFAPGGEIRWQHWTNRAIFDDAGQLVEFQSVGRDITERKRAEEEIARRARELAGLHDLALATSAHLDPDMLCRTAAEKVSALVGADVGLVYLADPGSQVLLMAGVHGYATDPPEAVRSIPFGLGATGQAAQRGEVVTITDLRDPALAFSDLATEEGFVSGAAVPLASRDQVLGVVLVVRRAERGFGDDEVRLLRSAGRLLALAIDNSRAVGSGRRRRAELSVLFQIASAGSRYHDAQPILDIAVDAIRSHMPEFMVGVLLGTEEEAELVLAAHAGTHADVPDTIGRIPWGEGLVGAAAAERRTIAVGDLEESEAVQKDALRRIGARAAAIVPIVGGERTLGVLCIACAEPHDCSPDDIAFVESTAVQIGSALHAANLYEKTRSEARRLAVVGELEREILGTFSRDEMLRIVGRHANDLIRGALIGLALRRPAADDPRGFGGAEAADIVFERLYSDASDEPILPTRYSMDEMLSGEVIRTGVPVIRKEIPADTGRPFDELLLREGIRSSLTVPILASGEPIGTLIWGAREPGAFSEDGALLALEIGNLLALALDRIRAYTAERRRAAELDGLFRAAGRLLAPQSVRDMVQTIADAACEQLGYARCCVMLLDPERESLSIRGVSGVRLGDELLACEWPVSDGSGFSVAECIVSGRALVLGGPDAEQRFPADLPYAREFLATPDVLPGKTSSYAAAPLVAGGKALGAVVVDRGPDGPPIEPEEVSVIGAYARHAGLALQGARLLEETQQTLRQLRETQEELIRLERLRAFSQITSALAHDLNNRMAVISASAELMLESLVGSGRADLAGALADIKEKAAEASDLVRKIQEATGSPARRGDTGFEEVDLCDIAQRAVWLTEGRRMHQAPPTAQVVTRLAASCRVSGCAQDLKEVILSLIDNALEAAGPGGGTVTVHVTDEGSHVRVSVADRGPGVPAEILDRIFDPFFTTKPEHSGGALARAKGVVERHGGEIGARNVAAGGAEVWFRIPVAAPAPAPEPQLTAMPGPALGGEPLRVLVVEDEPLVRKLLVQMIRRDGHEATEVGTAESAIKALEGPETFDVVFTDLGLPGMSGWDVADWISANRPGVAVVLVTGWGDEISEEDRADRRIAHVLAKPFTGAGVREALAIADSPPS